MRHTITIPRIREITVLGNKLPVTLGAARLFGRVDDLGDDDSLLESLIVLAAKDAENRTKRFIIHREVEATLDDFPIDGASFIHLPLAPVISLDSVKCIDEAGNEQTFAATNYRVFVHDTFVRLVLNSGVSWPSCRGEFDDVRIRLKVGYTQPTNVPDGIQAWIKAWLTTNYENRSQIVTGTIVANSPNIDRLLDAFIVRRNI